MPFRMAHDCSTVGKQICLKAFKRLRPIQAAREDPGYSHQTITHDRLLDLLATHATVVKVACKTHMSLHAG